MTTVRDMADWSELCRACLGKSTLVPLLDGNDDIKSKFFESTTITVSAGDGLPAYLCLDCLDTLNYAHQFRKECLRIDSELKARLLFKKSNEIKEENDLKSKKDKTEKVPDTLIKIEELSDEQTDDDCYYVVVIKEGKDGQKTMEALKMEGKEKDNMDADEILNNIKIEQDNMLKYDQDLEEEEQESFADDYETEEQEKQDEFESTASDNLEPEVDVPEPCEEIQSTENESENTARQDKLNLIQVLSDDPAMVDENMIEYGGDSVALVDDVLNGEVSIGEDGVAYTQEEVVVSNGDENFEMLNDGTVVIEYDGDDEPITVIQQEDGSFLCDCGESFMEFADYEQHKWTHNDFACPICGRGFESKEIVAGHIMLHNQPDAQLACPFCSQLIKRNMLTTHIKISHNQCRPTCGICNKSFASENNLKRHMLIHGVRHYECDICHKRFNQKSSLQNHRLAHGSPGPNNCDICQKEFDSHDALTAHIDQGCDTGEDDPDTENKRHICGACGKEYTTAGSLRSHVEYVHNAHAVELLCSECGEVLPTRKAMYAHTYTHRQSRIKHLRRFSCGICGKGCASHAMLLMHERVHTNERPFKCTKCTLAFKTKTHLTTHQLTHTQEKRFGCSVCMKFFALKGNLVVHLRTHTGERPYVCSICGQAFIDSKYLKKHKLRRHDIANIPWNQYY